MAKKEKKLVSFQELADAVEVARKEVKNPYGQSYLRALPTAAEEYGAEGVAVQLLYVLNNITTWRGEEARRVKGVFRDYLKQNGHKI